MTESTHVDKAHLKTAVAAMTDVAATVNEYKRRKELGVFARISKLNRAIMS